MFLKKPGRAGSCEEAAAKPLEAARRPRSNLTISTKLVAGFSAISIAAVLVGLTGLYFIDKINTTLNNISDVAAPTVETSDDLIALVFEATKVAEEIIADEDIADIEPLVAELATLNEEFGRTYQELSELVTDKDLLELLTIANRERAEFNEHVSQMIVSHKRELEKEAESLRLLAAFDDVGAELIAALDEFAEENEVEMAKAEEEGDRLEAAGADGASINRVLGYLFDQDYPVVEAALKLQRLIIEMQDTAGEYLAEKSPAGLGKIEAEFLALYGAVQPHLDVLGRLAETEEDEADTVNLQAMLRTWVALAYGPGQLFDTHRDMLEAENAADVFTERLEVDADNAVEALDKVAASADAISDGADEAAESAVDQARTTIFSLLVFALVGSVALLGLIVVTVVRPIKNLTDAMVTLGERYGQAITPAQKSGDEVHQLRSAFDHLEQQVQQRTAQLQQRTVQLNDANQDLEQELNRRRSLEQQLVHAQKLDGLGTLAGGIAHDFNNMLYVILGCTEIALSDVPKDSQVAHLIGKVDQAARRSKSIVNQILFFSRRETPDRKPLDVSQAVRESVTLLRAGLPSSMALEVEIEDASGIVLADEVQIQQVIVNLTTNAYQAHGDGKGTISLCVKRVEADPAFASRHLGLKPGPYVRLTVKDEGAGIPDEILPKIYDPFFTTKPVGEGTGLGLAVVHGIVAAHEGVVITSTKVGQGTTFDVYLPVWAGEAQQLEGIRTVGTSAVSMEG